MGPKVNKHVCPKCSKSSAMISANTDGSICCRLCAFWYHPTCAGLERQTYELYLGIMKAEMQDMYTCMTCKESLGEMCEKWEKCAKRAKENSDRLDKVEVAQGKLETVQTNQEKKIQDNGDRIKELEAKMEEAGSIGGAEIYREMQERGNRQKNIIIHRIPESSSRETRDRIDHDEEMVEQLFMELGLTNVIKARIREDIKFLRRLGTPGESEREPRPLQVGFRYISHKEKVMSAARRLKDMPEFSQIMVVDDLTKIQREEDLATKQKAWKKNLERTEEEEKSKIAYKVIGPHGQRRIISCELFENETIDGEGKVRDGRGFETSLGPARSRRPPTVAATGGNAQQMGVRVQQRMGNSIPASRDKGGGTGGEEDRNGSTEEAKEEAEPTEKPSLPQNTENINPVQKRKFTPYSGYEEGGGRGRSQSPDQTSLRAQLLNIWPPQARGEGSSSQ